MLFCGHIQQKTLVQRKLFERFKKKNCKKQIKQNLELKKEIKKKGNKHFVEEL